MQFEKHAEMMVVIDYNCSKVKEILKEQTLKELNDGEFEIPVKVKSYSNNPKSKPKKKPF